MNHSEQIFKNPNRRQFTQKHKKKSFKEFIYFSYNEITNRLLITGWHSYECHSASFARNAVGCIFLPWFIAYQTNVDFEVFVLFALSRWPIFFHLHVCFN
jgi:hypothetical protein